MNSVNKIARTAGLFYLLYVITSVHRQSIRKICVRGSPGHCQSHHDPCISIPHRFCDQSVLSCIFRSSSLGFVRAIETD